MADTHSEETVVSRVLEANWPSYCQMLDPEQIRDIARQARDGKRPEYELPEGGANFDVQFALKVAIEAATLVSWCIKIYKQLMSEKGRKPTAEEVKRVALADHGEVLMKPVADHLDQALASLISEQSR